jgi:hypothetical protein
MIMANEIFYALRRLLRPSDHGRVMATPNTRVIYKLLLLLVCIGTSLGCPADRQPRRRFTGASALRGEWSLTLSERKGPTRGHSATGAITLQLYSAEHPCRAPREECMRSLYGAHSVDTSRLLGYQVERVVGALLVGDSTLIVGLGRCCHREDVELAGSLTDEGIEGTWEARRMGVEHRGTFVLRRIGPAAGNIREE